MIIYSNAKLYIKSAENVFNVLGGVAVPETACCMCCCTYNRRL